MHGFCNNNALYSGSLSFIMFIFLLTLFDTWDYYCFQSNLSLVLLTKRLPTKKHLNCRLGQEVACWFQCLKNSFDWSNWSGVVDMKMGESCLAEKSFCKRMGPSFTTKLDWGSYIMSITKTASKKIGALIGSITFVSSEVALYLYNSIIQPYMECCYHIWSSAPTLRLIFTEINFARSIFADFSFFGKSTKICLQKIWLIHLFTKVNPHNFSWGIFQHGFSFKKNNCTFNTLNYK